MRGKPWAPQIAEGRVFELRSKNHHYPPPCALIVSLDRAKYRDRFAVGIDREGVIGDAFYRRRSNPAIYIGGLNVEELTKRIVRRRHDLERLDCYDLALVRYGYGVDFDGRISSYGGASIPISIPARWTVFWTPPGSPYGWWWPPHDGKIENMMRGAWWFTNSGGARHLGYKFGHMWATRHTGAQLDRIRQTLRRMRPDIIEQDAKVVRWQEGDRVITQTVCRESPVLGMGHRAEYGVSDQPRWLA